MCFTSTCKGGLFCLFVQLGKLIRRIVDWAESSPQKTTYHVVAVGVFFGHIFPHVSLFRVQKRQGVVMCHVFFLKSNMSKCSKRVENHQLSSNGCLLYIGDFTTQLYGDYFMGHYFWIPS